MHKVKPGEHPAITVPLIGGATRPPRHIDPEFVDCKGLEAGWGIKRSLAYQLLADNKIRGVSLAQTRCSSRGKRLFRVDSVRAFLREQMENKSVHERYSHALPFSCFRPYQAVTTPAGHRKHVLRLRLVLRKAISTGHCQKNFAAMIQLSANRTPRRRCNLRTNMERLREPQHLLTK